MENENKIPEIKEAEKKPESPEETKDSCCTGACKEWCTPERKKIVVLGIAIVIVAVLLIGYKFDGQKFKNLFQHEKVLTSEEAAVKAKNVAEVSLPNLEVKTKGGEPVKDGDSFKIDLDINGQTVPSYVQADAALSPDEIEKKALDFIKSNLVQPGTDVSIKEVALDGTFYRITVGIGEQSIPAYVSLDGKKFMPNILDMDAEEESQSQPQAKDIPKSDKPDVKLFVMSYCPYGTQIEKGILPVIETLGDKINFTLEFVDYAMHNNYEGGDRKELDENTRQYCIQKNQPAKLDAYLTCFLKKGQGTENACMAESGVNAAQVATCMKQADTEFNITKNFSDKSSYKGQFPLYEVNKADNEKYGVGGSPTLIINDTEASPAGRDSASLLETICSAFNDSPQECQAELSSAAPAPGFGEGTAPASSGDANCGS